MKIFSLTILLLAVCLQTPKARAFGLDEVVLLETSTSKKSVIIDRGLLENYRENTVAKFFVQTGDFKFPKIFLVAEGKLVKLTPKKSTWLLTKVVDPRFIQENVHLLILNSTDVTVGRPMKIKQRHVVNESLVTKDDSNLKNTPQRLLKEAKAYESSDELYETENIREADLQIETTELMRKKSGIQMSDEYNDPMEEKYFVGQRLVEVGNIVRLEDKKLLDSMALGLVEKVNAEKYGLTNGLYKDQKKTDGSRELNQNLTVNSVYDQVKEDDKRREEISPQAKAKMKRDGAHWSEDMDDATLRRYFIRSGLEHEARRRDLALNELDGNEITFHYAGSMVDHSNDADQNYRNLGYTLALGYDLHLSRSSKDLKNWSLQFILEKGVADYSIGGSLNARGQEGFYGAYLNYYFINNPLTLNSFIFLGGIGLKAGNIDMTAPDLSKQYSYQVLALPAFQVMTKYRFRSGDLTEDTVNVGASLNAGISLDMKRLTVIDSLEDDINGKISINDVKYLVGMGFYF
jgi:hypothetical protein